MEYIEVTGKSVEEAITNACTKLGIPSDKLDYEVIDKGNSGFLGIFNSKPAKIKAREKQEEVCSGGGVGIRGRSFTLFKCMGMTADPPAVG